VPHPIDQGPPLEAEVLGHTMVGVLVRDGEPVGQVFGLSQDGFAALACPQPSYELPSEAGGDLAGINGVEVILVPVGAGLAAEEPDPTLMPEHLWPVLTDCQQVVE